jgi:hypothetical protein
VPLAAFTNQHLLSFDRLNTPLEQAVSHYVDHVRRRTSGFFSAESTVWELLEGSFLHAHDCYKAVRLLVADNLKPHPMPVQASVLARNAVEVLGNVLSLTEIPRSSWRERALDFWRDAYRASARTLAAVQQAPHASQRKWQQYIQEQTDELANAAAKLKLSAAETASPEQLHQWPRPGGLLNHATDSHGRPYLSGVRLQVFQTVHDFWYGEQSRMVHPRNQSVSATLFARDSARADWTDYMRTDAIICAAVCLASILGEIESVSMWAAARPQSLRETWQVLRGFSDETESLYQLRYRSLSE